MITIKNKKEIEIMREGGMILKRVFERLKKEIKPGITTSRLDQMAKKLIIKNNAKPSFLGYNNYPNTICASVNNEVVHGIPNKRKLKNGDILSLDIGVFYKGFHTDAALTVPVGKISKEDKKLIEVTKKSLFKGLKKVKDGQKIQNISATIQYTVEKEGFSVVRDCTGHGIGKDIHEDPAIPNFRKPGNDTILHEGFTIAIEPMVNAGTWEVKTLDDGWTIVTLDGKKSAHFELTVLVTKKGFEILTPIL